MFDPLGEGPQDTSPLGVLRYWREIRLGRIKYVEQRREDVRQRLVEADSAVADARTKFVEFDRWLANKGITL